METVVLSHILVGLLCIIAGAIPAAFFFYKRGQNSGHKDALLEVFRSGLLLKNPEMWDLLHSWVVEERERSSQTNTSTRSIIREEVEKATEQALEKNQDTTKISRPAVNPRNRRSGSGSKP